MKRLLNRSEEATKSVLDPLTEQWGAHTYPKVRLADVLPIDHSGIDDQSFRFALQSHFDFVVTDHDFLPLFAVEFDGPTHEDDEQKRRDSLKNQLCEKFELPLLRINARYIGEKYRQLDLLTWFVNYWFAQRAIDDAYSSGGIPEDAYVDPTLMMTIPGSSNNFPLWLTADVRMAFHKFRDQGLCVDPGPSSYVGLDTAGNYRAIAYMAVTETLGLMSETGMRWQSFPVPCSELVDAIAEHQVFEDFKFYLENRLAIVPFNTIAERLKWYSKNCQMMMISTGTESQSLRELIPPFSLR
ncbi:MAG: DUF2726 domain-containing protein [Pirellulales bacterium]